MPLFQIKEGGIYGTKDGRLFQVKRINTIDRAGKRRTVVLHELYNNSQYYTGLTTVLGYYQFCRMVDWKRDNPESITKG